MFLGTSPNSMNTWLLTLPKCSMAPECLTSASLAFWAVPFAKMQSLTLEDAQEFQLSTRWWCYSIPPSWPSKNGPHIVLNIWRRSTQSPLAQNWCPGVLESHPPNLNLVQYQSHGQFYQFTSVGAQLPSPHPSVHLGSPLLWFALKLSFSNYSFSPFLDHHLFVVLLTSF